MTHNENGLCHVHQSKTALDWEEDDQPSSLPPPTVIPSNKLVLRKSKNGLIYWPDTNLVVKSFKEPFVFAKDRGSSHTDESMVPLDPLDEYDISYCDARRIPYKLIHMSFQRDNNIPKDIMQAETKKIVAPTYSEEEGLEF